jgi:hypothetical protein
MVLRFKKKEGIAFPEYLLIAFILHHFYLRFPLPILLPIGAGVAQ